MAAVRPGRLIYVGQLADAHRHRHAAVQLVLATEPVELRDVTGDQVRDRMAIIPPGVEHEIAAPQLGWWSSSKVAGSSDKR